MLRFLFSYIKSVDQDPRKKINILAAAVVSGSLLLLSACGTEAPKDQNEKFEGYTQEIFCSEVSSNTINLHYTLKSRRITELLITRFPWAVLRVTRI